MAPNELDHPHRIKRDAAIFKMHSHSLLPYVPLHTHLLLLLVTPRWTSVHDSRNQGLYDNLRLVAIRAIKQKHLLFRLFELNILTQVSILSSLKDGMVNQ